MPKLSKLEWFILTCAMIALVFCVRLLFDSLDPIPDKISDFDTVGEILSVKNDSRLKQRKSFQWILSKQKQRLAFGDSIFTGPRSETQIDLKKGNSLIAAENSLFVLEKLNGENILNLQNGNFRLKVQGEMKVAVNGKVTKIQGYNSDVQIFLEKNGKPKINVLKGDAKVIAMNLPYEARFPSSEASVSNVTQGLDIRAQALPEYWKLHELFEQQDLEMMAKIPQQNSQKIYRSALELSLSVDQDYVQIFNQQALNNLNIHVNTREIGFIVQASTDKNFTPGQTKYYWSSKPQVPVRYSRPGNYYYRVTAVNADHELSAWSNPQQIVVMAEPVIAPKVEEPRGPRLAPLAKKKPAPAPEAEYSDETTQAAVIPPPQIMQTSTQSFRPPEKSYLGHSGWSLAPILSYSRIDGQDRATGSPGVLLSQMNFGVAGSWKYHFAKKWNTFLDLRLMKKSFADSASRHIEQQSSMYTKISTGVDYQILKNLRTKFGIALGQESFYEATSINNLKLTPITVPQMDVVLSYQLTEWRNYSLFIKAAGSYLQAVTKNNYQLEAGQAARFSLAVSDEKENRPYGIKGEVFYDQRKQNAQFLLKKETELGFIFNWDWDLLK